MTRMKKITETPQYEVRLPIVKDDWEEKYNIRFSPSGHIYLRVYHGRTSVHKTEKLIKEVIKQLEGRKANRRIHNLLASISGTKLKIKEISPVDGGRVRLELEKCPWE